MLLFVWKVGNLQLCMYVTALQSLIKFGMVSCFCNSLQSILKNSVLAQAKNIQQPDYLLHGQYELLPLGGLLSQSNRFSYSILFRFRVREGVVSMKVLTRLKVQ